MIDILKKEIQESIEIKQLLLNSSHNLRLIEELINDCIESLKNGGKIIFCGNGGSFADSQHLTAEFISKLRFDRNPLPAVALGTNSSNLTAIGNDYGFKYIFSRQLEAIGQAGDVAIGITTSGKSQNVLEGLQYAKENKMKSVAFTGRNIKKIEKITDEIISIPARNTSRIQEAHILIGQMLCNALEFQLGLSPLVNEEKF